MFAHGYFPSGYFSATYYPPAVTAEVPSYGATNYFRNLRKKHKLPAPEQDFTSAVARALELELRLRAEKQAAERELEAEKRRIAALRKTEGKPQGKASKAPDTAPNSDFVAKRELLRYKIRQYDAELDSLRNYEIGARLLAIQTERVAAVKDEQDMQDILMILALDEA